MDDASLEEYVPPYERFRRVAAQAKSPSMLHGITYAIMLCFEPVFLLIDDACMLVFDRKRLRETYRKGFQKAKGDIHCKTFAEFVTVVYCLGLFFAAACFFSGVFIEIDSNKPSALETDWQSLKETKRHT